MKTSLLMAFLFAIASVCNAQSVECNPSFIAYNDANLPIKTIELKNFYTGYTITVYNPFFPYDFGEREAGTYVFKVTYDNPTEGSIGVKIDGVTHWCSGPKWDPTWSFMWTEAYCQVNHIKIVPDISCRE